MLMHLAKFYLGCDVGRKPITQDACCQMRTSFTSFKALAIRTVASKWPEHCLHTCRASCRILEECTTLRTFQQNSSHENSWCTLLISRSTTGTFLNSRASTTTFWWYRMLIKAIFWVLSEFHQPFPKSCKFILHVSKSSRRIKKFWLLKNCSWETQFFYDSILYILTCRTRVDIYLNDEIKHCLIGGRFFSLHGKVLSFTSEIKILRISGIFICCENCRIIKSSIHKSRPLLTHLNRDPCWNMSFNIMDWMMKQSSDFRREP